MLQVLEPSLARHRAELAGMEIDEGLLNLGVRVHDEGPPIATGSRIGRPL